jgi:hypothetical protein
MISAGKQLDPQLLGSLVESHPNGPASEQQDSLAENGYLFVRGLLDPEVVKALRVHLLHKVADHGQLHPEHPVEAGIAADGANCAFMPELANGDDRVWDFLYEDALPGFFDRLLGKPSRHYDFTWLRVVAPGKGTHPHMDLVYMGRGTDEVYTAWIPLSDVSEELGGLIVLEGSHRSALTESYAHIDVDAICDGGDQTPMERAGFLRSGAITDDPVELRNQLGGRWLTADYRAGDVLIFGMYTAHASLDNQSNQIRLSIDCRFQAADLPADERWIGENPPAHRHKIETIC